MSRVSTENYNIKTRIGPLLFDIVLDDSFRSANAPSLFNRHCHSTFEIHFIVEGGGFIIIGSDKVELRPNYYYCIPPGIYHAITRDSKSTLCKYTIRFDYVELNEHDLYFPANEVEALKSAMSSSMQRFSATEMGENLFLLEKINEELEHHSLGYYTKLQSYFNQILINVIRSASPGMNMSYKIPRRLGHDKRSQVIESFFDRYNADLTLEDLATELRLSPRQTNRILQKMYNRSFRQKLIDIRIEESKARLKDTEDSIMLIAEQLGFTSYPLFQAMFKQNTGLTPQAYRKHLVHEHKKTQY